MDSSIACLIATEIMRNRLDGATHAADPARTRRRRIGTSSPGAMKSRP
jgi:hypothetical protein